MNMASLPAFTAVCMISRLMVIFYLSSFFKCLSCNSDMSITWALSIRFYFKCLSVICIISGLMIVSDYGVNINVYGRGLCGDEIGSGWSV